MRPRPTPALLSLLLLAAGCPSPPALYAKHVDQPFTASAPVRLHLASIDIGPDVVTIDKGTSTLSVVWNDGKGNLSKPQAIDAGPGATVVDAQVADVVGDRWPDLLALLPTEVEILQNLDGQSFAVPARGGHVAPGTGYRDLLVGDFNGDGHPDLFIVGDAGTSLWLGPDFAAPVTPPPPTLLADPAPFVASLDGNARDDVVGVRQGTDGPELVGLLGQASGGFTVRTAPPLPAGDVISAIARTDFHYDPHDDVLVGGKGFLGYYLMGDTGFGPPSVGKLAGLDPLALASGDLGGTSLPDLVVTDRRGELLTFLGFTNGSEGWSQAPPRAVGPSPTGLGVADMDGFFADDIVVSTEGTCCPLRDAGVQLFTGGTLDRSNLPGFTMEQTR